MFAVSTAGWNCDLQLSDWLVGWLFVSVWVSVVCCWGLGDVTVVQAITTGGGDE